MSRIWERKNSGECGVRRVKKTPRAKDVHTLSTQDFVLLNLFDERFYKWSRHRQRSLLFLSWMLFHEWEKKDKKHFALTPHLQHLKTIFSPQQVCILYKAAEHNMTLDLIPVWSDFKKRQFWASNCHLSPTSPLQSVNQSRKFPLWDLKTASRLVLWHSVSFLCFLYQLRSRGPLYGWTPCRVGS